MNFEGGDSLNRYILDRIEGNSHAEIIEKLNRLRIEYSLLSINTVGSNWYATISTTRRFINLNEKLNNKGNNNGSSKRQKNGGGGVPERSGNAESSL